MMTTRNILLLLCLTLAVTAKILTEEEVKLQLNLREWGNKPFGEVFRTHPKRMSDEDFHKSLAETHKWDPKNSKKGATFADIEGAKVGGIDALSKLYNSIHGKTPEEFLTNYRTGSPYEELQKVIDNFNAANQAQGDKFLATKNRCAIEYAFDPPPPAEKEPECEKSYKKSFGHGCSIQGH